jgi:hypothetical protein
VAEFKGKIWITYDFSDCYKKFTQDKNIFGGFERVGSSLLE